MRSRSCGLGVQRPSAISSLAQSPPECCILPRSYRNREPSGNSTGVAPMGTAAIRTGLRLFVLGGMLCTPAADAGASEQADGYRGIWFTLGQFSQHGDKYSGGLGTYTANHNPMAVYSP